MRSLVWFREKDLRVGDHGPLREAAASGEVIPLFVLDPGFFAPGPARLMPARTQVLLDALADLEGSLGRLGSRLRVMAGPCEELVPDWAERWKVDQVLAHRRSEPSAREIDVRTERALSARGIAFRLFEGETLVPPGSLRSASGRLFEVFTAFARAFHLGAAVGDPLPAPGELPPLPGESAWEGNCLPDPGSLGLERNPGISQGGETSASKRLKKFILERLVTYYQDRDRLDLEGTSRLSVDLHFGTISARTLWRRVSEQESGEGSRAFLRELLWREFAHHWLWERPGLLERPFRRAFEDFPWRNDETHWRAWAEGRTGYPLVDAAARQLMAEGFVHNRARMVAASFLAKHLLVDFRRGEARYMSLLADADQADNDLGWQWSAGCGCDAQPWFRIFNPVLQGRRFDPGGAYVRRWIPELAHLPAANLHMPRRGEAGEYPPPIVDLLAARDCFLRTAKAHLGGRAFA
ncbi:MAG TPA: deoxyribodipyrimidine photo-lyase [Holophaga sp.]|nr:deoxyribodipyrimidine photo-lyase [Holophaga sp.]HPS66747.1 deoxyribodipyrimidine photo-lyase [Holophaga sp.]